MNEINITQIVVAVIGLIVALVSAFLIPYLKEKYTSEQLSKADAIITIAVGAAEQIFGSQKGQEKKDYVLSYLDKQGIKVDWETVDVMIENAVLQLHQELYGGEPENK